MHRFKTLLKTVFFGGLIIALQGCPVGPGPTPDPDPDPDPPPGAPNVRIDINQTVTDADDFVTWAPYATDLYITNPEVISTALEVRIRNRSNAVGRVSFATSQNGTFLSQITVPLDPSGARTTIYIAGQSASINLNDAQVEVINRADNSILTREDLMVRVRKNANQLTSAERDRFLTAFTTLHLINNNFQHFMDMHTSIGDPEAHRNFGFLPWHRALLLDLERELQSIDPAVTIPYWKFDEPAQNLFTREFLGADGDGFAEFALTNPMRNWQVNGVPGINRTHVGIENGQATSALSEIATLALGGPANVYDEFRFLEGNPHGSAHVSFSGWISGINTAPRDPLFFLLHCNVDRLWAKWQWVNDRFDRTQSSTFTGQGNTTRIGHNVNDTMWPWNRVTTTPRPPDAPGGRLASTNVPQVNQTASPRVGDMIDYQGKINPSNKLGFDYDDVPIQ